MPAEVMYQRVLLEYVGGFDPVVSSSADYDLYLRIARQYPVHQHSEVVADYRRHGTNMTRNPVLMLKSEVTVLRRQRRHLGRLMQYRDAYKAGMKHSQKYFGEPLVEEARAQMEERRWHQAIGTLSVLMRYHPRGFASALHSILPWKGR